MADTIDPTLEQAPDVDTEEQKKPKQPVNLAQTLQAGQQAITQEVKQGDPAVPLDSQTSQYYLDRLRQLSSDPSLQSQMPPDTRSSLREAMDKAENLYREKANRNEWLEVAQTLGRAVAQFGAAQSGMRNGYNMSGLDFGPGIDYNKRTDQAFRDYQQSLRNAATTNEAERQHVEDTNALRGEQYKRSGGYLTQGLGAAEKEAALTSGENRADARARLMQSLEDQREAQRQKRADESLKQKQTALNIKDLGNQERTLSQQIQAAQQLGNALQQEDELSSSSAKRLQEKYSQLAGKAGVDLAPALEQYEKTAPTRNREIMGMGIPGTSTIDKTKATKSLYDALGLTDKIAKLKELQAQKSNMIRGNPTAAADVGEASTSSSEPPKEAAATAAPQAKKDPKIQQYADQYKLDYDQAKKVLVGRGYSPAE